MQYNNHCLQFLLGITVIPREIKDNGYAKFGEVNKVRLGLGENSEWNLMLAKKLLVNHKNCQYNYSTCKDKINPSIKWLLGSKLSHNNELSNTILKNMMGIRTTPQRKSSPVPQSSPMYPGGQSQRCWSGPVLIQVPPFWHSPGLRHLFKSKDKQKNRTGWTKVDTVETR